MVEPPAEARAVALDQREQALLARERALAEQQRGLAEEYRLLRDQPAQRSVEAPASRDDVSVPPVPAPRATRFDAVRVESFWDRLKRIMLGVSVS